MDSSNHKFLKGLPRFCAACLAFFLLCALSPPLDPTVVTVFPSPATGSYVEVSYLMPSDGTAHVYIYNEAGDLVAEQSDPQLAGFPKSVLNLYYFRRGVYICRVVLDLDTGEVKKLKLFKFTVIR